MEITVDKRLLVPVTMFDFRNDTRGSPAGVPWADHEPRHKDPGDLRPIPQDRRVRPRPVWSPQLCLSPARPRSLWGHLRMCGHSPSPTSQRPHSYVDKINQTGARLRAGGRFSPCVCAQSAPPTPCLHMCVFVKNLLEDWKECPRWTPPPYGELQRHPPPPQEGAEVVDSQRLQGAAGT